MKLKRLLKKYRISNGFDYKKLSNSQKYLHIFDGNSGAEVDEPPPPQNLPKPKMGNYGRMDMVTVIIDGVMLELPAGFVQWMLDSRVVRPITKLPIDFTAPDWPI